MRCALMTFLTLCFTCAAALPFLLNRKPRYTNSLTSYIVLSFHFHFHPFSLLTDFSILPSLDIIIMFSAYASSQNLVFSTVISPSIYLLNSSFIFAINTAKSVGLYGHYCLKAIATNMPQTLDLQFLFFISFLYIFLLLYLFYLCLTLFIQLLPKEFLYLPKGRSP